MTSSSTDLKQLAALAFAAAAERNWVEFERLEASIPRRTCEVIDPLYTAHLQALKTVALHFAVEHWRRQALLNLALHKAALEAAPGARRETAVAAARPMESELLALDRAVARLAEIHGFDVMAMRRWAGLGRDGFEALYSHAASDPEAEKLLIHLLGAFLDDGQSYFARSLELH